MPINALVGRRCRVAFPAPTAIPASIAAATPHHPHCLPAVIGKWYKPIYYSRAVYSAVTRGFFCVSFVWFVYFVVNQMEAIWKNELVSAQTQLIARSLKHWTGRELAAGADVGVQASACPGNKLKLELQVAEKIFHAPFVLVSHGMEADPVLNYGNAAALALWEMSWEKLTRTPSRLTAEAPDREERARLLNAVGRRGFIDDYSGVRISKTGRRFRIAQATVWNLISAEGKFCGQAAMFSRWEFL